jgi:multisubunit Na+/H+ antiporter MnhG subunit
MKKGFGTTIIGVVIIAVFTILMFYLLKGFWAFATFFAWFFLIVAAVVNYKVIVDYVKRLFDLLQRNILYGVGGIIFSVLLYPIVFFVLMLRALGGKALEKAGLDGGVERQEKEEFSDYEVLEEEILDLKELEKRKMRK